MKRPRQTDYSEPEMTDVGGGAQPGFRTDAWRTGTARTAAELVPIHPTVLHAFATAARRDATTGITLVPESPDSPEEQRPYRALWHRATRVAAALANRGVAPGDRVLLVMPTSFELIESFFAVQLLGAVPVPSYPPALLEKAELALDRLGHIAAAAGARLVVTNAQLRPVILGVALRAPAVETIVAVEDLDAEPRRGKVRAFANQLAFLQYTSGSTGRPKGVALSHGNLVANIHAIGQACRISRADTVVSWLPLYHDMGLIGALLFAIYWRTPLVLMAPTTFLLRPRRWLEAITTHRGTLSPAPNFAYALCARRVRPGDRAGLDLSSWRLALNGAEPVNLRTLIDFERAFAPVGFNRHAFLPVYGLAEVSLAATFPTPGAPLKYQVVDRHALADGRAVDAPPADGGDSDRARRKSAMAIVSVGRAVPGHEVRVVDTELRPLGDREVGHVVVRGPSVMQGYFGDAQATAEALRGGWLWTGDLGYFADGDLYITGRAKDLIIVRGKNHYAEDLERVAERVPGVRAGATCAFAVYDDELATDRIVIVCETKIPAEDGPARAALAEAVRARVGEDCGVALDEVALVAPGAIPKTSSGKRQRSLCRELYASGELERRVARSRLGKAMALARVGVASGAGLLVSAARRLLR
jgi:acyl-CoA synthetase (AMP-forming)/AMP-acid ligase II